MHCTNCGAQLAGTAKFCHVCGAVVQRAPQTPPPPPVEARSARPSLAVPRRLLGCGAALLGVLLLVGLALVAAYFFLGLHRDSGIAELAPEDATAVVVIRPSLWQLYQLRDTGRLAGSAAALAPLVAVPGVMDFIFEVYYDYGAALQSLDIDPVADVLPWIGREAALASMGPNEGVVVAAAVRDETRAAAFLDEVREHLEDEGFEFDKSTHDSVTITEVVGPEFAAPLAYAVADGRLLLAASREGLEDALDRARSDRNTLAENDAFRDALAAQPRNRLGAIYINPAALGADLESLDALRWVGGVATLTGNGTRFSYRLGFDRDRLDSRQREWMERDGIDNVLARRIPEDTVLYVAGHNLGGALDYAAVESANVENVLNEARDVEALQRLIRLIEDMSGEFAIAITADDEGLLREMTGEPFGMLFAAQVEDGDEALAELDDIFDDIARKTFSDHETDEIGQATAGYLDIPDEGGRILGYGVDGDDVVVGTSENLIETALEAGDGLGAAPRFRATLDALPGGGLLYFYFDADEIDRLVDELGIMAETSKDYTWRIEAIGLVVEPLNRRGDMNLDLFFLTDLPRR